MLTYIYNLATDKKKGSEGAKRFLYFLSLIYSIIVRILIFVYRLKPRRLGCKVISVGNITLGGTGKTTLVLLIAQYLKQNGHKVAVLTRGYKRKNISPVLEGDGYESIGDEPYMLRMNLKDIPVIVDSDRIHAAKSAIKEHGVDTVILDDGMQQWRIKKDLEIIVIDATSPFGNRRLIPRGILREPLSSLKRADIFVLTKVNLSPDVQEINNFLSSISPRSLIVESVHAPVTFCKIERTDGVEDINALQGKYAALFSGIGEPGSFEELIKNLGIKVGLSFKFPDHHNYTRADLEKICKSSHDKGINIIITTEKDAVRINSRYLPNYNLQFYYLRIELKITKNEPEFYNRLLGLYSH